MKPGVRRAVETRLGSCALGPRRTPGWAGTFQAASLPQKPLRPSEPMEITLLWWGRGALRSLSSAPFVSPTSTAALSHPHPGPQAPGPPTVLVSRPAGAAGGPRSACD